MKLSNLCLLKQIQESCELLAVSGRLSVPRGDEGLSQGHRNVYQVGVEAPTEHSDIA